MTAVQLDLFGGTAELINWVNNTPYRLAMWECSACGCKDFGSLFGPVPTICPQCGRILTGGKSYAEVEGDEFTNRLLSSN